MERDRPKMSNKNFSLKLTLLIISFFGLFAILCTPVLAQNGEYVHKSNKKTFEDENPLYLVNIGDANLAIRYKKGEGIPIIFVHGSWDDHHSWMPVAERLITQISNPVILYDRRGHSASTPDKQQGSISEDVNDALLLMQKLGFEKAHFIGHSYGANIVVQLASLHPEKAATIILYEPPMFGLLKDIQQYNLELQKVNKAMATAKTLLESGDIEKGTIHFIEQAAFGENSWKNIFDERARSTMIASYRTWLDQTNDPQRLHIQPEKLNNFNGTITVLSGTHSIPVYLAVAKELKKKVPTIQLKIIPQAGHGGLISHTIETTEIIEEHLKKL